MEGRCDCYLIDHAWTFKQRNAYRTLKDSEKLRDRLDVIMKYSQKRDLPASAKNICKK